MLGFGLLRPTKYDNNSSTQNIPPNSWIQTCSNNTGNISIGSDSIIGLCKDNHGVVNIWNGSKVTQILGNSSRIQIGSGSWVGLIASNTGAINLGENCHVEWILNNSGTITAGRYSTFGQNGHNMVGNVISIPHLPSFSAQCSSNEDPSWPLCAGKKRQCPDSRYLRSLPVPSGGNQGFEPSITSSPTKVPPSSKGYPTEGSNEDLNRGFYQYQIKAVRRSQRPLSLSANFTSCDPPSRHSNYTATSLRISIESRSSFLMSIDSGQNFDAESQQSRIERESIGVLTNGPSALIPTIPSEDLEAKCCAICMERPRDVAFNCGHISCQECSQHLSICHICRESITSRQKLYTN